MKRSFSKQLIARLMPYACFFAVQVGATTATAQNMPDNTVYNNVSPLSNNNINVLTGPNMRGGTIQQGAILSNTNLPNTNINNGNRRQAVNATQTAVRPVTRRPRTSSPAARRQPSQSQGTQRRAAVRPVTTAVAAPVAIQAPSQVAAPVINLVPENVVVPVEQLIQNNDMPVQSNPLVMAPVPSSNVAGSTTVRRNASSSGSLNVSVKATHHKSKKKKRGGFYYAANKKVVKFFATSRKGKIDPAKCFVWR